MYEEKVLICIECGKQITKVVLEGTDTSQYLCPSCELGELNFDIE